MKNRLKLLLLSLSVAAAALHAEVPAEVKRAVAKVNEAPSLQISCTINGSPASMTISGECFVMDFGEARVYYDGNTQWAYNVADAEVTVIEPTDEELAESNPLRILGTLASDYDGAPVKGRANTVRLTPRSRQSDVAEATVEFDSATGWPVNMTIVTSSGRADITGLRFTPSTTKTAPSAFKFRAPKGTTVIDLR